MAGTPERRSRSRSKRNSKASTTMRNLESRLKRVRLNSKGEALRVHPDPFNVDASPPSKRKNLGPNLPAQEGLVLIQEALAQPPEVEAPVRKSIWGPTKELPKEPAPSTSHTDKRIYFPNARSGPLGRLTQQGYEEIPTIEIKRDDVGILEETDGPIYYAKVYMFDITWLPPSNKLFKYVLPSKIFFSDYYNPTLKPKRYTRTDEAGYTNQTIKGKDGKPDIKRPDAYTDGEWKFYKWIPVPRETNITLYERGNSVEYQMLAFDRLRRGDKGVLIYHDEPLPRTRVQFLRKEEEAYIENVYIFKTLESYDNGREIYIPEHDLPKVSFYQKKIIGLLSNHLQKRSSRGSKIM